MKLRNALLAATILAAPVAAKAEPVSGIYIGAGAGINIMQNETVSAIAYPGLGIGTTPVGHNTRAELDPGFAGMIAVGYGLGNGLRLEVEGDYRQNKFKKLSSDGFGQSARAGGDEKKYGAMFNALYDFDLGMVMPYVGAGIGYQYAQHQNARFAGQSAPFAGFPNGVNQLYRTNQGQGSFAYQGIAGVAFPIGSVPGLALTLDYRFMGLAGDRNYPYQYFASGPAKGGIATGARVKFQDDYNHTIMFGVRYAFGAAPAPVPVAVAAPAPAPARSYLVFFDWDKYNLTDRARQIITDAAANSKKVTYTKIESNGYTDTSGSPAYNKGLSVRRAQAVAAQLVKDGVPKKDIVITGFGETNPLVPTGNNVREPQNRRVEIVIK